MSLVSRCLLVLSSDFYSLRPTCCGRDDCGVDWFVGYVWDVFLLFVVGIVPVRCVDVEGIDANMCSGFMQIVGTLNGVRLRGLEESVLWTVTTFQFVLVTGSELCCTGRGLVDCSGEVRILTRGAGRLCRMIRFCACSREVRMIRLLGACVG